MRVGTWNVQYGHEPDQHARRIMARAVGLSLHQLALQELRDYALRLRRLATEHGWQLLTSEDRQLGLLVAPGRHVGRVWTITAGTWWTRATGQRTPMPQALVARVEDQLVIVVHAPVGAWVVQGNAGRRWIGPWRRRLAYRLFSRRIVRVFRRHPGMIVSAWGDWNASPDTRGRWSPEWVRRRVGGSFMRPHASTGHGEVDYGIGVGLEAETCYAIGGRMSDHKAVVARVHLA